MRLRTALVRFDRNMGAELDRYGWAKFIRRRIASMATIFFAAVYMGVHIVGVWFTVGKTVASVNVSRSQATSVITKYSYCFDTSRPAGSVANTVCY